MRRHAEEEERREEVRPDDEGEEDGAKGRARADGRTRRIKSCSCVQNGANLKDVRSLLILALTRSGAALPMMLPKNKKMAMAVARRSYGTFGDFSGNGGGGWTREMRTAVTGPNQTSAKR